jgi:hypothetical protein
MPPSKWYLKPSWLTGAHHRGRAIPKGGRPTPVSPAAKIALPVTTVGVCPDLGVQGAYHVRPPPANSIDVAAVSAARHRFRFEYWCWSCAAFMILRFRNGLRLPALSRDAPSPHLDSGTSLDPSVAQPGSGAGPGRCGRCAGMEQRERTCYHHSLVSQLVYSAREFAGRHRGLFECQKYLF